MNFAGELACIAVALAAAACSGGGDADRTAGTTGFDGEVPRLALPREGGTEWFNWPWRPFLPNHVGRRWAFIESHTEGAALAYVLVSWDDDDPADYLAAGYWLWFPGTDSRLLALSAAEPDLFMEGTEIGSADLAELGVSDTATYVDEEGDVYRYRYGSGWTDVEERELAEEFGGPIEITTDFSDNAVSGCIGCTGDLEVRRQHFYMLLRRCVAQPVAQPTNYEIRFCRKPIGAGGSFDNPGGDGQSPGPHGYGVELELEREFFEPARRGRQPLVRGGHGGGGVRGSGRERRVLPRNIHRCRGDLASAGCWPMNLGRQAMVRVGIRTVRKGRRP